MRDTTTKRNWRRREERGKRGKRGRGKSRGRGGGGGGGGEEKRGELVEGKTQHSEKGETLTVVQRGERVRGNLDSWRLLEHTCEGKQDQVSFCTNYQLK